MTPEVDCFTVNLLSLTVRISRRDWTGASEESDGRNYEEGTGPDGRSIQKDTIVSL